MKKILFIFIAICLILPMVVSCTANKKPIETDNTEITTPMVTTPEPVVTPTATYKTWVVEGYEKVYQDKVRPKDHTTDISLYMAKNERESFHIAVNASASIEGLKVSLIEGNRDDITVEFFEEHFVKTGLKYYPDPIVPFDGTFSVTEGNNSTILIRFGTKADTEAGEYVYKFNLTDPAGNVISEYTVDLTVWDYTLPEVFTTDTAIMIWYEYIHQLEGIPARMYPEYCEKYYNMLLDYGFCSYSLPYDILKDKADAYMSNSKVTHFRVPHDGDDAKITEYYNKLKSNPEWLEKAYFYPFDEPTSVEHLDQLAVLCKRLKELAPEIRIVIPFFKNVQYDGDTDEIDFLDQYLGIWCPKSACWKDGWLADPLGKGYFGDRMEEQKAEGDKIWWYVCWEPGPPFCNLYVNEVGLDHVKLFWQQYQAKSDGFLYWGATYWHYTKNPWEDMATVKWLSEDVYGDGSLFYPGKQVGIKGPVASLRLDCMRNGLEDIEMLKIAEELLGREWVDEQVAKVSKDLTTHEKDNDKFNEVRKNIGEAIVNALKSK